MKNRQAAMLIGMVLCLTAITGCSSDAEAQSEKQQESGTEDTETEDTETEDTKKEGTDTEAADDKKENADGGSGRPEENRENQIFGKIVSVSEDSITISVEASPADETEDAEKTSGTEEQTIALTENTVIQKQTMRQPEGEAPDGKMTEQEAGEEIAWSDLKEGDMAVLILDEDGNAESVGIMDEKMGQPGGGQSQQPEEYQAETAYTEDTQTEDEVYTSEGTDENAVLVSEGAEVVLKNPQITRTSEDSTGGDTSSFYGVGAALLASDGKAFVSGGSISTDAAGGAGLFAYDKGTVYASGTTIKTEQDTAGGVHAAGGGSFYGWDLDVTTEGESSAAIRSDRGGGTMVIDGGNYISNGTGSPAVYCTADIAVNNAALTANGSEAVCIEGLNSLHLYDCDLTGNMSDDDRNDCTWNVILYQSMSGDSQVGNSTFEMNGGSLTGKNGGMFYTTNTESTITLSDVEISYPEDSEYFLKCTGNANERGWGESGSNGADCLFTAISQEIQGDILWDSISQLDVYLTDQSSFSGAFVDEESNAGSGGDGYCAVYVEKGSEWTVTENSTVTELHCEGTITDEEGKTVTIKGTDGTVYVEGDSSCVVTTEVYEDSADCSGASSVTEWSTYETEKPEEL